MTFIKFLRRPGKEKSQATLEYFIIFSIIAILTILSFSAFFPKVQQALGTTGGHGLFQKAVGSQGINVDNH